MENRKSLSVPDLDLAMASLGILLAEKKPTTAVKVLAALISVSDNGVISSPKVCAEMICRQLDISPEMYRQITMKLKALNLISKVDACLYLNVIVRPAEQILLVQSKNTQP